MAQECDNRWAFLPQRSQGQDRTFEIEHCCLGKYLLHSLLLEPPRGTAVTHLPRRTATGRVLSGALGALRQFERDRYSECNY